jgi:hypothetical protein
MSIDSDTSTESMDTLEFEVHHTYDYGSYIYNHFKDPEINWDSPPFKIANMSEAQCLAKFRFRKDHLQLLSNCLWTKMQLYLDGDYDHIKLENQYQLPFEMCLMLLLYRLSVPHRSIHPDIEKFFGI